MVFFIAFGAASLLAAPPTSAPDSSDRPSGAYLNTSFEAEEALARTLQRLSDASLVAASQPAVSAARSPWSDAASALHDLAEKYGDYVIGLGDRRFINIRDHINSLIAAWPPEGRAAYREVFESAAQSALAAARSQDDADAYLELAERFYPTRAAALALDEAAELAIERGDFASPRRWYHRLLDNHPDRAEYAILWRAKLALCAAYSGDPSLLDKLVAEFNDAAPGPQVPWAGRTQSLREFLVEFRSAQASSLKSQASPQASSLKPQVVPEARLWRFTAFGRPLLDQPEGGFESQLAQKEAVRRALQSGALIASIPTAGDGLIFLHDAHSAWAVDPQSPDKPRWQFNITPNAPSDRSSALNDDTPALYTSLFDRGRLYIHLERDLPESPNTQTPPASSLVCLDARTGRLLWRNDLVGFASDFEEARLDGAPILHQGKLFAVARRRKPFGFESCFLLRFDSASGRLLWTVHLGEAPTGSYGYHRPTLSLPAAHGDLVFVPTNLGAIAAVSASTGRLVWIRQYDSRFAANPDGLWPERMTRTVKSWTYPAPVLWRDSVVVFPLDVDEILVLNQDDGQETARLPLDALHNPEVLLGLVGDRLYAVGLSIVCYDLAAGKIAWHRSLEEGPLFGRGVLAGGGVFIPTQRALLRYDLDGGPARLFRWALEESGNLLAIRNEIIVSAPDSLFGLVAKDDAFAGLARRMADAPEDPAPALALAELSFNARDYRRGLDAVDQAVARFGGFARLADDDQRRRLFQSLTAFAHSLLESNNANWPGDSPPTSRPALPADAVAAAVRLLTLAGQCAPQPADQVAYRLQLALAHIRAEDVPAAVRVYQQVLLDRGLRRIELKLRSDWLPPTGRDDDFTADAGLAPAGVIVTQWIESLIRLKGRPVYDAVERQAADRLKVAEAAKDPAALLEVADTFPNSLAAARALLSHARIQAQNNDWPAAARSYRRAISARDRVDRPAALAEFIPCLASAGRRAEASHWLDRALREYPAFRFTQGGRQIGFKELRALLLAEGPPADPAHALAIGVTQDIYRRLYQDRVAALDPLVSSLPDTRWDDVLTWSAKSVEARSPATGRALWPQPVACSAQPTLLGMDDSRFILVTPGRLFALTRTSGQLAWQVGKESPDDPTADPESIPAWTAHALTPATLFSAGDKGDLVAVNLADGQTLWHKKLEGQVAAQLVADPAGYLVYTAWQGRRQSISVLNSKDGSLLHTIEPLDNRPVQSLAIADAGLLVVVLSSAIQAVDLASGKTLWHALAPDHFLPATLQLDPEGLIISSDGRRLTKYDFATGRLLWKTPPIAADAADGLWAECVGGILFAASSDTLFAFDASEGQFLWKAKCPGLLKSQAPRITADSIVCVSPEKAPKPTAKPDAAPAEPAPALAYRIRRFRLTDGQEQPIAAVEGPSLLSEPLESFGGLVLRDRTLLLLDGNRLIAYVAPEK